MKRFFIFAIAVLSLFSLSCNGSDKKAVAQEINTVQASLRSEKIAPDFELTDLKENKFILSNYKGKNPVLLFFWTTECPLCGFEIPVLNKMYPELIKDNLIVASINVGEDPVTVADYMISYPDAMYPMLLDMSFSVARKYRVFGVPTYVLIDKDGYIVFTGHRFSLAKFKELIH